MFEQYENLPGVKVSYEDGNLHAGNQVTSAATQSVLIIGTAVDGPMGEPVSVNAIGGPEAAEKMFGGLLERVKVEENGEERTVRVPHQGSLIRGMWEAIRSGNEDVRLLRVSGKTAKTELPVKDPNSEVQQPLADALGNQLMPGNIPFQKVLNLSSDQRLVQVEKVEEYGSSDVTGEPVKVFPDSSGYQSIDTTVGAESVYFGRDMFRPGNTIKVTYKVRKRTYTEVTRNMNGVDNPSTLGVLTQDPSNTSYFSSEVGNWSDDPLHATNVYVVDSEGDINTIPSRNQEGRIMYRIGKEDPAVTDELNDDTTQQEFRQGGIRFTSAYHEAVAQGMYPALTAGVKVYADYFYYNDLEIQETTTEKVPGSEKVTFLNFIPLSETLEVYYENLGVRTNLSEGEDYTIAYPSNSEDKVEVRIKSGAAPVGARLFAYYKTSENSTGDASLIVNAASPGKLYGKIEDVMDYESLEGVKVVVEYETNPNGTVDMENRVIRFIKPLEKRTTSSDIELRFRTKALQGIRTLREFANYVNGLPNNNIVELDVPLHAGDIPLRGLLVTDYNISSVGGRYHYRPINLGERYDADLGKFSLYIDDSKDAHDPNRFPWLGSDGFFNNNNLLDMKNLYETLGGVYDLVEGTLDEFELVEQGIYSKLENYSVDQIVLMDVYANTAIGAYEEDGTLGIAQDRNFATQLAQHCAMTTAKSWETIGVIGVAPALSAGLKEVQDYIDLLTKGAGLSEEIESLYINRGVNPNFVNNHYMYNLATHDQIFNDNGEPIDIGQYVSVVFGPEVGLANESIGSYVSNGASIYSALISRLQPEVSTTNQVLSAAGLRYNLSESQHNQLAGGRYVTFDRKISGSGVVNIVVKDGVTAALPTSDYQRLSTLRIAHATVQLIRTKADKFIGLPNGLAQRNSLATEIQAGLDRLKELGVLQNFEFSIYSSAKDRVLGNAFITLQLVPAYETRKIYTSVSLRASL